VSELGRLAPTRSALVVGQRRAARFAKGAQLLRRKREALVTELLRLARPASAARTHIAEQTDLACRVLLRALAVHGRSGLRALGWPPRELSMEVRTSQVWGVTVHELAGRDPVRRSFAARGTSPGTAAVGALAADEFEVLADLLLDAAPRELVLRRLGAALAQTTRQVNTLEHRVTPALEARLVEIGRALEEREREEHTRLIWLTRRSRADHRSFVTPTSATS
jgi:V/A-type H+-transporting ATPase subunit D